jgi:GNAT superfamily N-acetyltransferase
MQYRILHEDERPALESFLSAHTSSTMFLRSNLRAAGMGRRQHPLSADYFAAVCTDGNLHAVVAHMRGGNVLVQGPGDGAAQGETQHNHIMDGLAAFSYNHIAGPVAGILGPSADAQTVMHHFGLTSSCYATNHDETLYRLELDELKRAMPPLADSYQVVDAAKIDRATLLRWMRDYEMEALGMQESPSLDGRVAARVVTALEDRSWWVLMVEGEPVALAGFNARLPDSVQLGPVWTPPRLRKQGYARLLVARCLLAARVRGCKVAVLFTNNPAAARAYEAVGFTAIGTYRLALLERSQNLVVKQPV